MIELKINPTSGTIKESSKVKFQIEGMGKHPHYRLKIENATHKTLCSFSSTESHSLAIVDNANNIYGTIDLNIPKYASQAAVSLFAELEILNKNQEYVTHKILPAIFDVVDDETPKSEGVVSLQSDFVSLDEKIKVNVLYRKNAKVILSVNDKRYVVLTDNEGKGSIGFLAAEVLMDKDINVVQKFPIYFYTVDDNFTKKKSSGIYIHIVPDEIRQCTDPFSPSTDPRCSDACWPSHLDPTGTCPGDPWTQPEFCLEVPSPSSSSTYPPDPEPIPGPLPIHEPTGGSAGTDCVTDAFIGSGLDLCRIHDHDSMLLPNGMVLTAFTGVDATNTSTSSSSYNKSKVFYVQSESTLDQQGDNPFTVIAHRTVIIPPKPTLDDDFIVYVQKDLYDKLSAMSLYSQTVNMYFFEDGFLSGVWRVLEARDISEYDPYYSLKLDTSTYNFTMSSWKMCIYSLIVEQTSPTVIAAGSLPVLTDSNDNPLSVLDVSIGTNNNNLDQDNQICYAVCSAYVDGYKQLFLYSFTIDFNTGTAYTSTSSSRTFGWHQLTSSGNNSHPKIQVDDTNTFHVFWESDRTGQNLIYYGSVGPEFLSFCNATISSSVDKEFYIRSLENTLQPVISQSLLSVSEPRVDNEYFSGYTWTTRKKNNGSVEVVTDNHINFAGYPTDDSAMAFYQLDQDLETLDEFNGTENEINYQISFDIDSNSIYDRQGEEDINVDDLYEEWLSKFDTQVYSEFANAPVYVYQNNKMVVGRQDNIYDRFIPILGSYKNNEGSEAHFDVQVSGDNSNVRHFMLGVMPSKSRFKATNTQTLEEYADDLGVSVNDANDYLSEEEVVVYDGKVKLAILMAADNEYYSKPHRDDYYGDPSSKEYTIVRQIGDAFDISFSKNIKIVISYSKLYKDDIKRLYDKMLDPTSSKFMCSIILLMDNSPVFSESFLVDFDDQYEKFDIGFGIPSLGEYTSNELGPYETNIYNELYMSFSCENIWISRPSVSFNENVIIVPDWVRKPRNMRTSMGGSYSLLDPREYGYSDLNLGLNANIFPQIPITLIGDNTNVDFDIGYGNDVHVTWQSNRDSYWNVYTANSLDRNIPFRHETQLSNTESNSIVPSIAVGRDNGRLVAWSDNRDEKWDIYCARATTGNSCNLETCSDFNVNNLIEEESGDDHEISFTFVDVTGNIGYQHFELEFYKDGDYTDLLKSIDSEDSVSGWRIDGRDMTEEGAYSGGSSLNITYSPQSSDGIFDQIYYVYVKPHDKNSDNESNATVTPQQIVFYNPSSPIGSPYIYFNVSNGVDEYDAPLDPIRMHFRMTFYADSQRESVVYSAFSLMDQKRWFYRSYNSQQKEQLGKDGLYLPGATGYQVIYAPEVQPHDFIEIQETFDINRENSVTEKPLLCGVKYYVTIETYNEEGILETLRNTSFIYDCHNVFSQLWREDDDAANWICSGQGQDDLRVSDTYDVSTFPAVVGNINDKFSIVWQNKNGTENAIMRAVWNADEDRLYGSGQGRNDKRLIETGVIPIALNDFAQSTFVSSHLQEALYIYYCSWEKQADSSTTSSDCQVTLCMPGKCDTFEISFNDSLKMRVEDSYIKNSLVVSKDKVVAVVEDKNIKLDIYGIIGTYACRLRNLSDTSWSDWIYINERGDDDSTAYLIDTNRFIVPWTLMDTNGLQRVCCQVLTFYGVSNTFCLDLLANYSETRYNVRFYKDSSYTEEYPYYSGNPLLFPTYSDGQPQDTTVYVRTFLNTTTNYSPALTFNVIQQGINDQYGLTLTHQKENEVWTNYWDGSFTLTQSDGIYNKDGQAIITVNIPNDTLNLETTETGCTQDSQSLDELNVMNVYANQKELRNNVDADPSSTISIINSSRVQIMTDINPLKVAYNIDDPRFVFGNKNIYAG